MPISFIHHIIEGMAANKLNVLHWHIVDSQAFPFNGTAVPALAHGAWSPEQTYSSKDVADIVAYAKDRGVRVMIEVAALHSNLPPKPRLALRGDGAQHRAGMPLQVDTPGHSASWGVGVPEVVADCPSVGVPEDGDGQLALDPSRNETYATVEALLRELGTLAPDGFFHLGGDEVRPQCWNSSSRVQAFMKEAGFKTIDEVENYYIGKLLNEVAPRALGKERTLVCYQEVFDNNLTLPKSTTIAVWKRGNPNPKCALLLEPSHAATDRSIARRLVTGSSCARSATRSRRS